MNYLDMQRAVDKIETRWGPSKVWSEWERLTDDFSHFTAGAFMEALELVYRSGQRYAPSPSEMMKRTAEVQHTRIERGVDDIDRDCLGSHVWADPLPFDVDRHRTCVLCGAIGAVVPCQHHLVNVSTGICVYCLETRTDTVDTGGLL